MELTAPLLPPALRDQRGMAWAAAVDGAFALEPWLACPLHLSTTPDGALWELARQFDVAGPLMQAMRTRGRKEQLVRMALRLQGKRGTPWAVEEVMRLLGYSDAEVIDRVKLLIYNGYAMHDGAHTFGEGGWQNHWREGRMPTYKGEALHDGTYTFGGIHATGEDGWQDDWRNYRIRLYIDPDSREFDREDRETAEGLAEAWAPLRSILVGWYIRHLATTAVGDPTGEAGAVTGILLADRDGNEQAIRPWLQAVGQGDPREAALGIAPPVIRWSVGQGDMHLAEVSRIALMQGERELDRQDVPVALTGRDVVYEGAWALKAELRA